MTNQITLAKSDTLPPFLQHAFKLIDAKDFDKLKEVFAEDFTLQFAHYTKRIYD